MYHLLHVAMGEVINNDISLIGICGKIEHTAANDLYLHINLCAWAESTSTRRVMSVSVVTSNSGIIYLEFQCLSSFT